MRTVILQPGYLPWLGYFDQMAQCDVFVLYDDVQYDKHGWRNRNRIKTANGVQWLTVPVLTKGRDKPLVKDVLINNDVCWAKKHLASIRQGYAKAPFLREYFDAFSAVYSVGWERLRDLDTALILLLRGLLGISCTVLYFSELGIGETDRVKRLVDACLRLGADEFLEGSAGQTYLEGDGERVFAENGVRLAYQDYHHPVYNQLHGEFVSHLSVVDLLFNHGPKSLDILTGREKVA